MRLNDFLEQKFQKCREEAEKTESLYHRGLITAYEVKQKKLREAGEAWKKITEFCEAEGIDPEDDERDDAYQALYNSVGIPIKRVPVRYYPTVDIVSGSICFLYGIRKAESLLRDDNVIGRTYRIQTVTKLGEEEVLIDYCFEVKKEICCESDSWEGWKNLEGNGQLEGYQWAEASIHVRERNGELQSVAIQKMYKRETAPIWKMHSPYPVIGVRWIGFYEDIPPNLKIAEGEFYDDETTNPPRGRNYRHQGILAYDDTDEIVILGIRDEKAEIVDIPCEIDGKKVTVIDKRCFANCNRTLKKVILPDTLKEIGDYAFEKCDKLEEPVIPPSVTKVGKDLFGKL